MHTCRQRDINATYVDSTFKRKTRMHLHAFPTYIRTHRIIRYNMTRPHSTSCYSCHIRTSFPSHSIHHIALHRSQHTMHLSACFMIIYVSQSHVPLLNPKMHRILFSPICTQSARCFHTAREHGAIRCLSHGASLEASGRWSLFGESVDSESLPQTSVFSSTEKFTAWSKRCEKYEWQNQSEELRKKGKVKELIQFEGLFGRLSHSRQVGSLLVQGLNLQIQLAQLLH